MPAIQFDFCVIDLDLTQTDLDYPDLALALECTYDVHPAEADDGSAYFAIDPEGGLDWEPTHWVPEPSDALSPTDRGDDSEGNYNA